MLSPWTVYWVLQLDRIGGFFEVFAVLSGLAGVVLFLAFFISHTGCTDSEAREFSVRLRQLLYWVTPVFLLFGAVNSLLPSTKTMCAVLTIPAVANSEVLQRDAASIYQLGMERLKEVLELESEVNDDPE